VAVWYLWEKAGVPRGNYSISSYVPTAEARRGRILAVVNQKGGVGKTTTAVNLTASLAAAERATLLVDIDPQANASSAYGVIAPDPQLYDALLDDCVILEIAHPTALSHLHLVPSAPDLVGAEIELVTMEHREGRMRQALEPVARAYDYIVIDCPPSLGLLTLNALTAADAVIIPLQCEYYALEGLARLLDTIERIRRGLNPRLEVEGILLTMMDRRVNLCRQVEDEVRKHFGDRVFATVIPRNVRLSEAPSHGKPILLYDIQSKGAKSYLRLAEELLGRGEDGQPPRKPPPLPISRAREEEEGGRSNGHTP
jgi:chromosome partitioning protein